MGSRFRCSTDGVSTGGVDEPLGKSFKKSFRMMMRTAIVLLALALAVNGSKTSRDALDERLKSFHGFYAERVQEIHQAGDETKQAVNKVTEELQSLFKMFVDELESMDESAASMDEKYKNLEIHWKIFQKRNKELQDKNRGL